jgi:hypothetical protein
MDTGHDACPSDVSRRVHSAQRTGSSRGAQLHPWLAATHHEPLQLGRARLAAHLARQRLQLLGVRLARPRGGQRLQLRLRGLFGQQALQRGQQPGAAASGVRAVSACGAR